MYRVVGRDIAQLQPQAAQATDMAHKFANASAALAQAHIQAASAMCAVAATEPIGSCEHRSWTTMQSMTETVAPQHRRIALLYQSALYEPLAFFSLNCLRAANTTVDETASKFGNTAVIEEQRVSAADNIAFEWAGSRQTKSCLMQQQLIFTSRQLAVEVRYLRVGIMAAQTSSVRRSFES